MKRVIFWKSKIWDSRKLNVGEEAIFRSIINSLKKEIPDIEIIVFSDDPKYLSEKYNIKSVQLFSIKGILNLLRTLKKIDLVIISGGTVFNDKSSQTIIPITLFIPFLAKIMGKRVMCYSVGVHELSPLGRVLVRKIVNRFDLITVRDKKAKEILENMGVTSPPIYATADSAFALSAIKKEQALKLLAQEGIFKKNQPLIGIAPRRPFHYTHSLLPFMIRLKLNIMPTSYHIKIKEFTEVIAGAADFLIKKYNAQIIFVPMYQPGKNELQRGLYASIRRFFSSRDDEIAAEIMQLMHYKNSAKILKNIYTSPEIMGIMREMDLFIGVPMHSLFLASNMNVPLVSLSYQSKVRRFMKMINQESHNINVEDVNQEYDLKGIISIIEDVWNNQEQVKEGMEQKVKILRKQALLNARLVSELLNGNERK